MLARQFLSRAGQRISRDLSSVKTFVEWRISNAFLGHGPWLKNRFDQRYQAMCFADYKHLRQGNPETGESLWMENTLRAGSIVLDVGANHGIISLECSLFVGPNGRIHAFEPAPDTRSSLVRHLEINNIQNVAVFGFAVGDKMGTARLRVYPEATGAATLSAIDPDHEADEIIEVRTVTIDRHCSDNGINSVDLLKIDVEGHELFALRGSVELLSNKRVKAIMFEVGERTCRNAGVEPQDLIAYLQQLDHSVHTITRSGRVGPKLSSFPPTPWGQNFLAFPNELRSERYNTIEPAWDA